MTAARRCMCIRVDELSRGPGRLDTIETQPYQRILQKNICHHRSNRHTDRLWPGQTGAQPLAEFRPPPPSRDVTYRDRDSLLLTDQHDQLLAPGDARIEQIAL